MLIVLLVKVKKVSLIVVGVAKTERRGRGTKGEMVGPAAGSSRERDGGTSQSGEEGRKHQRPTDADSLLASYPDCNLNNHVLSNLNNHRYIHAYKQTKRDAYIDIGREMCQLN